jgi:hypothetical protein
MTADEVVARLAGGGTVSLDTNISRSSGTMEKLLALVGTERGSVTLVVSAPAFFEVLSYQRRKYGARFRPESVSRMLLENLNLKVADFTQEDAEHVAACIAQQYPNDAAWQAAKIDHALRNLRLRQPDLGGRAKSAATIDWLVAGQASNRKWLLATEDKQEDVTWFADRLSYDTLMEALERLASLKDTPPGPAGE